MDSFSQLRGDCVRLHEFYTELRAAGFTRWEALYLLAGVMSGGPRPPQEDGR
ncbi:hypothetical protein J0910_00450 [Nocardiopsis sp. CNT-189]|uniref:hypothetical protein n=1 Tax=Nocardiopsis oceanisediminis TaxID=2816862 RepID=UPI003B2BC988